MQSLHANQLTTIISRDFDLEVARDVGERAAIILHNIAYWIYINKAQQKEDDEIQHFQNGRWWTYQPRKSFIKFFPYLTERQIRTTLELLEEKKYIITGNFNKNKYDKTIWYALGQKGETIYGDDEEPTDTSVKPTDTSVTSNGQKCQFESHHVVKPIPDLKPNLKPYIYEKPIVIEDGDDDDLAKTPSEKKAEKQNERRHRFYNGYQQKRPEKKEAQVDMTPYTHLEMWEIADRKDISLQDVWITQDAVIDSINTGNKYKLDSVKQGVLAWVNSGIQNGKIARFGDNQDYALVGREMLKRQHPDAIAARKERERKLDEQEKRGIKPPSLAHLWQEKIKNGIVPDPRNSQ